MTVCDLTYAYNDVSGGIRTYIDAKRAYLRDHTDWEHLLVIPGERDDFSREGRLAVCRIRSPILPGSAPYRFILRPDKVLAALRHARPDLIELGSLYTLPWTAFHYRRRHPCTIFGFYHTDLPSAYVRPAVSERLGEQAGAWAFRLTACYVRALYERCDATVTASPALKEKLTDLGLRDPYDISLGVDLGTFHPRRRSEAVRCQFGVEGEDLLMIYAGRFDTEKRVLMMVEALRQVPTSLNPSLALVGQGPLEDRLRQEARSTPGLHIVPFQKDKSDLARLLASADLYLAANPHETFGLSVVEAQACGLPVIGVKAGALIERVPASVGRLGAVDDAGAMARNVAALARSGDLRRKGENAREWVKEHFSWESTFDQLCTYYRRYTTPSSS